MSPLADRLRPMEIDDVVGQPHLLGKGCTLRKLIDTGHIPNLIFFGPSGVGKTTVAGIIAAKTGKLLRKLNGTSCSTADLKAVFDERDSISGRNGILLYLDEIQYLNKKQQQTLLEYIEDGTITLIASTTENPYFYIYNAILSRCTVFEFKPVDPCEVEKMVTRGFDKAKAAFDMDFTVEPDAIKTIAMMCGGDVRKAINAVEVLCFANDGVITEEMVKEVSQRSAMRYDRDGDAHYDILSAFQKSMRGSDENAALHYLARLLEAGDLLSACRRLLVTAAEDVGLAYPMIIPIVKAAVDSAVQLGLPEAKIPLADAVILVCTSPKSNTSINAISLAMDDVQRGNVGMIPNHLRDGHYAGAEKLGHAQSYKYAHDYGGWVEQQYLPDDIKDKKYYDFGNNKVEQAAFEYRKKQRNL